MQDEINRMSQHIQTLERKVKDQQQNLEQRNQCSTDNEKAIMNRETALLKNITRLNNDLTEKSEKVKEVGLLHEKQQRDGFRAEFKAQKKEWASENAKLVAETKKLREENRELVSQVSQLQRVIPQTGDSPSYSHEKQRRILKEEATLKNRITLLKDLTQKCKNIEELKLYVTQLLSKNEKWEERFKSYFRKMDDGFREQHELWEKDCSKKNDEIDLLRKRIVSLQDNFTTKEFYCEKLERKLKERQEVWAKEKLELEQGRSRNVHKMDKLQSEIESQSQKKKFETELLHKKVLKLQEDLETAQKKYQKEADSKLAEQQQCWDREKRELENHLSQKNHEIERLQTHEEKQQKKLLEQQGKISADFQKYHKEVEHKRNEKLECARNGHRESEQELSKKIEKIQSLQSDIEKLQSTVIELREMMETEWQIQHEELGRELERQEFITQEKLTLQKDCSRKDKLRQSLKGVRQDCLDKEVQWKEEKVELENRFKEKTLMRERLQKLKEKRAQERQPQPAIQVVPQEPLPCKKSILQLPISEGEVKDDLMDVKQKQRRKKKSKQDVKAAGPAKSKSENGEWTFFTAKPNPKVRSDTDDTDATSEESDIERFSSGQIPQGSMFNSVPEMPHSPRQIGDLSNLKLPLPPKSSTSDLNSRSKKSKKSVITFSSWSDISESDVDVAPKKASTTSMNKVYTINSPDKRREGSNKTKPSWLKRIGNFFKGFP
uniref:Uncharacterized protein n=1 Tax=Knipowitschia caucasica TaxID=637954 RepID=A0AAV2JKS9_KNICA